MTDTPPSPTPRRPYRKPAVRAYGGLAALTRMAIGDKGTPDGGAMRGMRRTGT